MVGKQNIGVGRAITNAMSLEPTQDLDDIWSRSVDVSATNEGRVDDLFAATAQRRHDAPALCAWDGELTYGPAEYSVTSTIEEASAADYEETPSRGERCRPSTDAEHRLRALWASTLGIDAATIGLDDSFFVFGSDSTKATRLVRAANRKAGSCR